MYEYHVPSEMIFGAGSRNRVGKVAKSLGMTKVLLVCDSFLSTMPVTGEIVKYLEEEGIASTIFSGVAAEPSDVTLDAAMKVLEGTGINGIVSFGGGSSIDTAKAVAVLAANGGPMSLYQGYGKVPGPGLKHIAVPTTAGTGSEATRVSIINDTVRNVKMMCLDNNLMVNAAIIDYELTMTMPKALTAYVGLDALTHGIEAYVSKKANPVSDLFAEKAIKLISGGLERAFENPSDEEARKDMMEGATFAGIAFSNASVCTVHGMSRPIGAYFHVPHGLSNAFLLPLVTKYSLEGNVERYARISKWMGYGSEDKSDTENAELLAEKLIELNLKLNVPSMKNYGIKYETYRDVALQMAKDAIDSGSPGNNPKQLNEEEMVKIYMEVYGNEEAE